jgi:thioredoxin reductase (NADPH)
MSSPIADPTAASRRTLLDGSDSALFPQLTDEQLALLARHGHVRPVAEGEVLFRDGDVGCDALVVLEGRVSVLIGRGGGSRELVSQGSRNLVAGVNLLTGQRAWATGVARVAGSVLAVTAEDFHAILSRELAFGDFILQTLFRRRQAIERLRVGLQIVGSRFDRDTHRLREFAARNRVLHNWLDVDDPDAAGLMTGVPTAGPRGPIVFLGDGSFLRNPSNFELAGAIGLFEHPTRAGTTYDLVVIGAGPAGLAAAVYGASSGLQTALLDAVAVGGQAATSARIENYLGFPAGISGAELAGRALLQAEKFKAHILVPRRAIGLAERDGYHEISLEDGDSLVARSVILALGVQYRRLPIPRVADYEGLGVTYATDWAREQLRPGDAAVVVGGANSAGQAALALSEEGRRVHLVVRAAGLERSMARYLRDRIGQASAIEVLLGSTVRDVGGDGHLEQVTVVHDETGARRTLKAGALVALIGAEPPTGWLADQVALDEDGYVITGPALAPRLRGPWDGLGRGPFLLETSRPGVFAVGDVRSGSTKMVAPAVGEGGMAVRFASEHLARAPPPAPGASSA